MLPVELLAEDELLPDEPPEEEPPEELPDPLPELLLVLPDVVVVDVVLFSVVVEGVNVLPVVLPEPTVCAVAVPVRSPIVKL